MSFSSSLVSFSKKSAQVRLAAFGQVAHWNGKQIKIVVFPASEIDQMEGGYEENTSMKCETFEQIRVHDLIQVLGKKYIVNELRRSDFGGTTIATMTITP